MLKHSNLKVRILFGYSIPILCLIGLSLIVYWSVNRAFERQRELENAQIVINGVNEITFGLGTRIRNVRGYALFPQDKTYLTSYENGTRVFDEAYQELLQKVQDLEIRSQLNTFQVIRTEHDELTSQIFQLINSGKINEAKTLLQALRMTEAEKQRQELIQEQKAILAQVIQEDIKAQQLLIRLIVGGTVLSIIFVVAIGLWVSHAIARPLGMKINHLVNTAQQISVGELTTPISISTQDSVEIQQLLMAFQDMTRNLSNLIRQVQQSSIHVNGSVTQISASSRQLETSMVEQVTATQEVMAATQEIAATSRELATTMEEVVTISQTTTIAAQGNQQDLVQMETVIQRLFAATQAIATRLATISTKANNINSIVVTINKVADQTNLLSLNAAIEAEKAGEAGLGFAIVAREIRRLADQTAIATLDIEQTVKEMQASVSTGVMEMDKFTTEVSQSMAEMTKIGSQLGLIIEQVTALTPRYEMVNAGMEAQSQGAQQISASMVHLSDTATHTAQFLREIQGAIGQLDRVSQELQRTVAQFKLAS